MTDTNSNLTRRRFIIASSAAVASSLILNMAGSIAEAKSTETKAAEPKASLKGKKIYFINSTCIGCQVCRIFCPANAINFGDCRNEIDQTKCLHCGTCYKECPISIITETEVS